LIFETPANYSIAAPIPSLPPTIHAGDSEVITFYVNVLADSESGSDYIGAQLTGTNAKTTLSISDLVDYSVPSDKRGEWIIQDQPKLVLEQIIASETVYLDQVGVGVFLKVRNDGEATAKWDLWNGTEIIENISLGTYLNQSPDGVPDPSPPFLLAGGQTATVRFNIDISPLSATGTAEVKAVIFYRDANNNNDYACYDPASTNWTIRAGVLQTFRGPPQFDPPYEEQASSFNLGDFKVYAKAYNLQPNRDFRLRWYPPVGDPIAQFTFTNSSGVALGSLPLSTDTDLLGNWSVRVTRITNEIPLCETSFEVVEPASLSVELKLPPSVTIGQTFVATMTFINNGGSRIDTASASSLTIDNPIAAYDSGPTPAMTTVPGKGTANITWNYTADTTTGNFSLTGRGYGVDSNDLRDLISDYDTSAPCVVQNPPQLNMHYVSLGQNVVFNNQQNISVDVGVSNTGEASAWITAADIEFSLGDYSLTLASPALPFLLQPGSPAVLNFLVDVAPTNAVGGDVTVTASYTAIDANWPESTPVTVSLTATETWELKLPVGYCSAYLSMTPEQYTFNAGQIVYAEYANLTPEDSLRLLYMTANKEAADADPVVGQFEVADDGTLQNSYQLPESITGPWKTELHDISGKSGTLADEANPLGRQFFTIQNPGSISSTMSFVPDEIEENEYVSLVMTVSNNVADGSTIKDIVPSLPLKYLNSSGTLVLDSGPVPASATLPAGSTATFTWTFIADENTGADGYLQMIATATGKDGNLPDLDPQQATSSTCISTNQLRIYYRNLDYTPSLLDFGNMICGDSKLVVSGQVNNLGSTKLTRVTWSKGFFISELLDEIHPSNLTLHPLSGFEVPIIAPKYTLASGVMQIPYNQPAGTYLATTTVFEDMMNPAYNGFLDVG
ncbi:MAG: hypothetical protein GX569_16755, partial [Candidatus Riflebacteria bacterium]|nr:hypothetical protein [Candidatus Riflebacteria bacterium]